MEQVACKMTKCCHCKLLNGERKYCFSGNQICNNAICTKWHNTRDKEGHCALRTRFIQVPKIIVYLNCTQIIIDTPTEKNTNLKAVGKLSVHQLTPAFTEVMPYPLISNCYMFICDLYISVYQDICITESQKNCLILSLPLGVPNGILHGVNKICFVTPP